MLSAVVRSSSYPKWQLQRPPPPLQIFTHTRAAPATRSQPDHFCKASSQTESCEPPTAHGSRGILQLAQLTHPRALMTVWQQQVQPGCLKAWEDLRSSIVMLMGEPFEVFKQEHQCAFTSEVQQQGGLSPQQCLQELDLLLGSLQQVLLVCGLLKDQHNKQEWQTAAAAVFVEARTLEQDICSDVHLQQGLLLAQQQLQLHQQQHNISTRTLESSSRECLLLARALRKHMQLEGLNPQGFAGLKRSRSAEPQAQVLSADEQRAILSGLQAEHRGLLSRMQDLLLNPAAAPSVQIDANSCNILLQPLRDSGASTAGGAAAVDGEEVEVKLDFQLVQQLLQQHPDADVRADVWSVGVLQQLDKLLLLCKDLAEVRRRIARAQGYSCYAELFLRHSLLRSLDAATAVCEQLAAALQPTAAAAAEQFQHGQQQEQQQHQQQMQQHDPAIEQATAEPCQLLGSDLEYLVHQFNLELLSHHDLQQLQPYLQLQHVMSGFNRLLQLSMGLSLRPRPAAAGEVWNDRVQVYELHDSHLGSRPGQEQQQQQHVAGDGQAVADTLLGTIYIDPSGGFAAQLVLYGPRYQGLWRDRHLQKQAASSGESSTNSAPCAVALGLQSHGALGETHTQLALGLWELCHELGHAVNFILSATPRHQRQHTTAQANGRPPAAAGVGQCYHMHAAWLPLEILELPSTLFEGFCMDPKCLQVLCQHCVTGEPMPMKLATKLAKFMHASHYHPLMYQHTVLGMLFDLQMAGITSRQLGTHAAHVVWQQIMTAKELAAMPELDGSLQQLTTLPRLLVSSGQGYGYAVAWCLAQLIMPSLLQHVHQSTAVAEAASSSIESSEELMAEAVNGLSSREGPQEVGANGRLLWRKFFSSGIEMSDALRLAELVVQLQQEGGGDLTARMKVRVQAGECDGSRQQAAPDATQSSDAYLQLGSGEASKACQLDEALQEHGLWPLDAETCDPEDVLVVCLTLALESVRGL